MQKTFYIHRQNVAVIGSGISGLSAAWLLNKHHNVTLYEANDYIGGHSATVDIEIDGKSIPVDTGFIVYNAPNYPNLTALFDDLGVTTQNTDMSFSTSIADGEFEYAGGNDLSGVFAQKSNLLKPRFWLMLRDLFRFYKKAPDYLANVAFADLTLGELLGKKNFSSAFIKDHLGPMGAAIWSSDAAEILDYPAQSFLKFFQNHGLLERNNAPQWRTVFGGSREYVTKISSGFKDCIRLNTAVQNIIPKAGSVEVVTAVGTDTFDQVILACHADQALALLPNDMYEQRCTLKRLNYRANKVVLHSDTSLMPRRRKAWASWNYIARTRDDDAPAVSYWMNRLQHLQTETPVIVTLNPNGPIDPAKVFGEYSYAHPTFNFEALKAKQAVWNFQGERGIWFCGAYLGDGFHEDGIQSGLAVAELLGGIARPWLRPKQNARIGLPNTLTSNVKIAAE